MVFSLSVILSLAYFGVVKSQKFLPGAADQCFEPLSSGGPCRAYFPSFYYNSLTETCDCFVFGGCGGNGNRFDSLNECMRTCEVNSQLQTISETCINIFGAEDSNFILTPRPINPRPVAFSTTEQPPIVTTKVLSTTSALATTSSTTTVPTTSAPIRPGAPVVTSTPVIYPSSKAVQQGDMNLKKTEDFKILPIFGSKFRRNGVSGQTTITIGQPVVIG